MRVTVDRVGRIVIPKKLRDRLGIRPETDLEVIPDGTGLRLEPIQPRARQVEMEDGLPILARVQDVTLTDDDVRHLRDELQR